MHEICGIAALWLGLALIATLISIWLKITTALSEIIVETVAQLLIGALFALFISKMTTKLFGVYPVTKSYKDDHKDWMYTTLLMSTGLTFGSISALFGLSHGIINQMHYSLLIMAVIASAVIPAIIANAFFIPRYLLPSEDHDSLAQQ